MTLRVVTDSSCDLPPEVARSHNITVVPCNVHIGDEVYRDGVDIHPEAFYEKLASGAASPKTSQPSIGTFLEVYQRLAGEAEEVLSLHISSKLSGTCQSARLAKDEVKNGMRIEVVDSLQVSMGLGILAVESARLAQQGASLDAAVAFLDREIPNVVSYFSVDTLEYLVRGGRASRLQGFFGSLLNIRPILAVRDGEVHPVDRVRSRKRLLERLREIVASQKKVRALGVLHSVCQEDAEAMADECSPFIPREQILISQFSPVMGAHLGPRALGLALWSEG